MKKKYSLRKIKAKRSYTSEEIAETLNIHIQTVREWHRSGMNPLKENSTPYLFMGDEVKRYLKEKIDSHKVSLKEGEFYCLSCKKAVKPEHYETIDRNIKIGKGVSSLLLKAECPECRKQLNRFSSSNIQTKSESEPLKEPINNPIPIKNNDPPTIKTEHGEYISMFGMMERKDIN